ncbi:hypothetical protein B0H67DRAFT_643684 [Lasiosphaeris hirsuta]|uniref:Uncharacterized protein n=1 Tax=Lasiosphaeris hirsuta TaxID=260670 RepID=A0AA40AR22_9PEZI|nr:hypothetical protein B0H67DRAFT_643684 [Lasiosphaeris hirsuta]
MSRPPFDPSFALSFTTVFAPSAILGAIVGFAAFATAAPMDAATHVGAAVPVEACGTGITHTLGGIDIAAACVNQHGAGWVAVTVGDTYNDWKCKKNGITYWSRTKPRL